MESAWNEAIVTALTTMGAWAVPVAGAAFGLWRVLKAQGESLGREIKTQGDSFARELKAQGDHFARELKAQGDSFARELKAQGDSFARELKAHSDSFARELKAQGEGLNKRLDVLCEDVREIRSELHVLGERVARIEGAVGVQPAVALTREDPSPAPVSTGPSGAQAEPLAAAGA